MDPTIIWDLHNIILLILCIRYFLRAFPMACVKFKPNFGLKSYFFYFTQSLIKTSSIRFSISNSILFKYYFFINFLLLFSTQLKPNKHPKKTHSNLINRAQQLQQKKNPANLQTFIAILQKIIKTRTIPAHQMGLCANGFLSVLPIDEEDRKRLSLFNASPVSREPIYLE